MEEWKEYKISEVIDEISMGPFGSNIKRENYVDFGVPYLNGSNLSSYKLNEDSFYFVTEEKANSLGRCVAKRGDIIVTHRGTIGQISYIPNDSKYEKYLTGNSQFRLSVNNSLIRPDFLVYYFHTRMGQHKLLSNASQVGVPALARPTSTFKEITIPVPSMETQCRIMEIILSLEDKIECNKRINENLEQQAQALFKSWFVDFEPFKDQLFVESELGMIPQGWKIGNIFNVADILDKYRKPLSGKDRENMDKIYPYYGATSCMDYVDNYIFDGIYCLIGEDGSVVKEDGFPYMQYVWGKLWVNNHAHILQGKNGFSTEMIHTMLTITNIGHLVTGAVQAKLSQANMQKIMVAIPPLLVLDKIRPVFDELYGKIRNTKEESRRLAELRDTLLPRLMSGEIDVSEIKNNI